MGSLCGAFVKAISHPNPVDMIRNPSVWCHLVSDFSKKLRRRRQEANLTQAQLAQRVGVKQQTVARWEHGGSLPASDTVASIAGVFGESEHEWVRIVGRDSASDLPKVSPPVRPLMDRLPLGELTPSDFERFTSYLLTACYPNTHVNRVGGHGHAQRGADIHVRAPDGIHIFQCKRVQRFGPAQMKKAAEAAVATNANKRVIVLSRVATQDARDAAEDFGWDIWDHDNLVRMLQNELSPGVGAADSGGLLPHVERGLPR